MFDWRNNPTIVALAAGSGVLTTTLFIVFTYVIPVYQKEDSNQISELKKNVKDKELLISELTQGKTSEITKKDSELEILNKVSRKISQVKSSAIPFTFSKAW